MIERERTEVDLSTVKNGDVLAIKIKDNIYFLRVTGRAIGHRYASCNIYGGPFFDGKWKSYDIGLAFIICSSNKDGELTFDKIEEGKSLCVIIMGGGNTVITDTLSECKLLE